MAEEQVRTESAGRGKQEQQFARAAIALLKGVVSRRRDEELWQGLLAQQAALHDYFARISLQLVLNVADEYAYLRQEEGTGLPRLVPRNQLGYGLSLLLVELRKTLGELTALEGGATIVTLAEMVGRLKPFFPVAGDELKFQQQVERYLHQAEEMGFLRQLPEPADSYEVRPLIRSFVDDQWLSDFEERLQEYQAYGKAQAAEVEQEPGLFAVEEEQHESL